MRSGKKMIRIKEKRGAENKGRQTVQAKRKERRKRRGKAGETGNKIEWGKKHR